MIHVFCADCKETHGLSVPEAEMLVYILTDLGKSEDDLSEVFHRCYKSLLNDSALLVQARLSLQNRIVSMEQVQRYRKMQIVPSEEESEDV
jgi:hypothetical protein